MLNKERCTPGEIGALALDLAGTQKGDAVPASIYLIRILGLTPETVADTRESLTHEYTRINFGFMKNVVIFSNIGDLLGWRHYTIWPESKEMMAAARRTMQKSFQG